MPSVFKPVAVKPIPKSAVVRAVDGVRCACWTNRRGRKVVAELTGCGTKCRVESPTWWVEYKTAAGGYSRKKGYKDRGATLKLGFDLEREAEDVRGGRAAPRTESPSHLIDHLPDYREALEAKGDGDSHVRSVMHNLRAVIAGADLTTPASVDCERVTRWLSGERKRRGWSQANANRYVIFLRAFGKWLVRTRRAKHNPFEELATTRSNGQKSRERRRLADEEFLRLVAAARTSKDAVVRGSNGDLLRLDGPNRARLYLLAAYTGFRHGTLAKLRPEAFAWSDGLPASVTAAATLQKNKKPLTIPLHPDVAAELADWLRSLPAGRPIFPPGAWSRRGADLVAHDLAAARAAWVAEAATPTERADREAGDTLARVNAAGEVFDFHALRVQFVSNLALAGVPLTAAQQLAGHSTPTLTANVYTRWGPPEMADQVAKLPGLKPAGAGSVRGKSPAGLQDGLQDACRELPTAEGKRPKLVKKRSRGFA